jgi:hypothetical protein
MTADEWIASFAEAIGVELPPSDTVNTLLELAASSAHPPERVAALAACHLVALAGSDPAAALTAAQTLEPRAR